jgi:TonB family protein
MRTISIALTFALIAPQVSAQSQTGAWALCSTTAEPAASIKACTDIIQSTHSSAPDISDAYSLRAFAYRRQGHFEQAILDYTQAISFAKDRKSTYLAYVNRGNTYGRADRHDEAIADYTRAITLEPEQGPAYEGRARSYEALDRRKEAIADYRAALKIYPASEAALNGLRRLGETDAAKPPQAAPAQPLQPDWEQQPSGNDLAALYPDAARAKGLGGDSTIQCSVTKDGRLANCVIVLETPAGFGFGRATLKAAQFFKMQALTRDGRSVEGGTVLIPLKWRLAPTGPQDFAELNNLCLKSPQGNELNQIVACTALINSATLSGSSLAVIYDKRGLANIESGENEDAIADFSMAIKLYPKVYYYEHRADAFFQSDKLDLAITDYSKAIEVDPNFATAYERRGMAFLGKGKTVRAQADFRHACRLTQGCVDRGTAVPDPPKEASLPSALTTTELSQRLLGIAESPDPSPDRAAQILGLNPTMIRVTPEGRSLDVRAGQHGGFNATFRQYSGADFNFAVKFGVDSMQKDDKGSGVCVMSSTLGQVLKAHGWDFKREETLESDLQSAKMVVIERYTENEDGSIAKRNLSLTYDAHANDKGPYCISRLIFMRLTHIAPNPAPGS